MGNEVIVFLCGLRRVYPNQVPEGALGEGVGTMKVIEEMTEAATE